MRLDKPADAEEDFSAAIARDDTGPETFYLRGRVRLILERHADAEQDFTAAIVGGMDDADVFVRRARSRLSQNCWAGAEEDLIAAQTKGRDDANLFFMFGVARRELKQYPAAERDFDAALARDPNDWACRLERSRMYLYRGKLEEAERAFDAILAQQPGDLLAHWSRALARYGQGNSAGAMEDCTAALPPGSANPSFLVTRAQAWVRLGRIEEAEQDCAEVARAGAESADAIGCQGVLLMARGAFEDASARFETARQAANDKDWHFQLGLALLLSGRAEEAAAAYRHGAAQSVPGDLQIALSDLDFWLRQYAERLSTPELQQAASGIRTELAQRLESENRGG
ncbi:MAG TPA: tetratricopeptide repeat protein [Verrucomicrobiae bacterium]|jgi:tetratricopeptide (TPR) repeat protein